jgi:DNA-binding NarL/FixJ family response regulator
MVLLGNLEPMVRLGMTGLVEGTAVEFVIGEGTPAKVVAQAQELHPDIVVLRLDDAGTLVLSSEVRAVAPDAKLILWARDEDEMQVFDPGSTTPRRIRSALVEALRGELTSPTGRGM